MMNGCRDGLLPRESAWWAWAKPWMMNNDSVAISPQEALRLQSAFYKRNPVDNLPLTRDRTLSRLGVVGDSSEIVCDITCLRQDSSFHQSLCSMWTGHLLLCRLKRVNSKKVLSFWMRKKNSQQKDKLTVKVEKTEERRRGSGRSKRRKGQKKEHVCKLTLTAQQGACVDGREMIWFTDTGKG